MTRALVRGILAIGILITIYFVSISLISGWIFAQEQFRQFWYYIVTLAIGFGIQVGLFTYLKSKVVKISPGTVTATGMTSVASMVSCCAHYLVNILPVLGVVGVITIIAQYQIQLFWVGIVFNLAGIIYMANRIYKMETI